MKNQLKNLILSTLIVLGMASCSSSSSSSGDTTASTYTVAGSVTGLGGTLVLQNNATDNLTLTADGTFTFDTALADAATYDVTVLTQPDGQICTVASGSGTISAANVTDVSVTCASSSTLTLSTSSNGSGTITTTETGITCTTGDSPCTGDIIAGTSITLTATPDTGYLFRGWTGDCSGTGTCELDLDSNKSVGAIFTKVFYLSDQNLDGTDSPSVNGVYNLWSIKTDSSEATPVTQTVPIATDAPTFELSPDGEKIVFASGRNLDGSNTGPHGTNYNIWVVDVDGSNLTPLTQVTNCLNGFIRPQWSPNGSKILAISNCALDGTDAANINNASNIWVMDTDGSNKIPVTTTTAANTDTDYAIWSRDSQHIAFASKRNPNGTDTLNTNSIRNIWTVDVDGNNLTALTSATANHTNSTPCAYTADDSSIIFESERNPDGSNTANTGNNYNIWSIDTDGNNLMTLTTLATSDSYQAKASPDGSQIIYISERHLDGTDALNTNSTFNVWIMNSDGTSPEPLTNLTVDDTDAGQPQWAPDGSLVLYYSYQNPDGTDSLNNTWNVWSVKPDGSELTPITDLVNANSTLYLGY